MFTEKGEYFFDTRMHLNPQELQQLLDFESYATGELQLPTCKEMVGFLTKVPHMAQFRLRERYIRRYGFALPCAEWVDAVKQLEVPILSVGCGSGYLEKLLQNAGVNVIATDIHPPSTGKNCYPQVWQEFLPIRRHGAASAVKRYPTRALFMSWPSYGGEWAYKAAQQLRPGNHLIYIGEWGGCTADEEFHKLLDEQFEDVSDPRIPHFWGLHDRCWIFRKRAG